MFGCSENELEKAPIPNPNYSSSTRGECPVR